ncbi:MAG: cbb3-type cytochrome oxidase assembly protein CcoS [Sphingomonadales bacterium]
MTGLLYLIPVALLLGLFGLAAFLWSVKSGQYDDLDGAPWRALFDDEPPAAPEPDSTQSHGAVYADSPSSAEGGQQRHGIQAESKRP